MLENLLVIAGLLLIFIVSFKAGFEYHTYQHRRAQFKQIDTTRPVPEFADVIEGKRFSTLDAKCIAQGYSLLGWMWLMRTSHNNFFVVTVNMFGVHAITPRNQQEAIQFFTQAPKREVKFEEAFPDVKVIDA
jgi:hypothetical protein